MELLKAAPQKSLSLYHVKQWDSDEKKKRLARSILIYIWQQHGHTYLAEVITDEPIEYWLMWQCTLNDSTTWRKFSSVHLIDDIETGSTFCQLLGLWFFASNVIDLWDHIMKTWTLASNGNTFIDTGAQLSHVGVWRGASASHMHAKSCLTNVLEVDVPWRQADGLSAELSCWIRIAPVELQMDDTSQVNTHNSTAAALLHACIVWFQCSMLLICGLNLARLLTRASSFGGLSLAIPHSDNHHGGIFVIDSSIQ